eukprot:XP_017945586.1 PREDICTED: serum response factor [Xenopus tropicalis]
MLPSSQAGVVGSGRGLGLARRAGNGAGCPGVRGPGVQYSGSSGSSDSGEEEDPPGRGLKRGLNELELPEQGGAAGGVGYPGASGTVSGAKPGKKTRGRVKIKMEFIDNKLRRYTTFSKRKTGIMKKVSTPGHLGQKYKQLGYIGHRDLRFLLQDSLKPAFTVTNLPGTSNIQTVPTTSTSMQVSSGHSFPITNYLAPVTSANGTVLKTEGGAMSSGGLMQIPTGFTLMSAGGAVAQQVPVQAIQVHSAAQASPSSDSSSELVQTSSSGTVTLPAAIMTSSVPTTVSGHMMYPSPHAVMYAPTQGLTDGGLAVLNAFSSAPPMQVSHTQEQGGVQQVFLTAPPGTVQIPVSAVQLHQMTVIGQQSSSSNLTELQVVNLDTSNSSKND